MKSSYITHPLLRHCPQRRNYYIVVLFLLLIARWANAQDSTVPPAALSNSSYAEKIYLQTDADVYTTDQTIWFKVVVLESDSHLPSVMSGVLHVDLIGPDGEIISRKRVKLDHGTSHGAFSLGKAIPEGKYQLRAYTEWNYNFGKDFVTELILDVFQDVPVTKMQPIIDISLYQEQPDIAHLKAKLFPSLIDEVHKGELTVYVIVDGKRDTITLKQAKEGFYRLDYPLPVPTRAATVQMHTKNDARYSRGLANPLAPVDLQFFPEGGNWIVGMPTKFGFKAINSLGKGIAVSGKILNERGDTVRPFRTNHLGMGTITLTATEAEGPMYAVLDSDQSGEYVLADRYELPNTALVGRSLAVTKVDDDIDLKIQLTSTVDDSTFVQVSCRGIPLFLIKSPPEKKSAKTSLPVHSLPEGVLLFRIFDGQMRPLGERLFFNERQDTRLTIQASVDSVQYSRRGKTNVHLQVLGEIDTPTRAKVSVAVMNHNHIGESLATRQNILTYFLLQSDLRGRIAEPNFYFPSDRPVRMADLDALLLTQGWRRYVYDDSLTGQFQFGNEPVPYISGTVRGVLSKRIQKNAQLTMMGFGESNIVDVTTTDSLGRFYFTFPEQFTDTVDVLLQTANKSGKNRDYRIEIDRRDRPNISYDYSESLQKVDSVITQLGKQRQERVREQIHYENTTGAIQLEEVLVERKILSPQEQTVLDKYGEADAVISGKAIQDKEQKWSYGLYSVLMFNFPDDIRVERVGGGAGHLVAKVHGSDPTLVVVDGIPVPGYSYDAIADMPPSEVKSVEIIRFAKNFASLFTDTYPEVSPLGVPTVGHVIAIYTHAGNGVYAAQTPTGILKHPVEVYSPIIEFYSPAYDEILPGHEAAKPDLRTLLHWEPDLMTDDMGNATIQYYNSDNEGETIILIEAIGEGGKIGYQEIRYIVD